LDNWAWGLSLIALTIAFHVTGVTLLVFAVRRFRIRLEGRNLPLPRVIASMVIAFTAMGLLLSVLHGIEAAFWAAAYLWLGVSNSPGAAIFFSVDAMTTLGTAGPMLHPHWQMMRALEAADGMLLFGISTAFIFTAMQFYYLHLVLLDRPGRAVKPASEEEIPRELTAAEFQNVNRER
jgi:hypothetical protein